MIDLERLLAERDRIELALQSIPHTGWCEGNCTSDRSGTKGCVLFDAFDVRDGVEL